jgi:hypothetical protein
MGQLESALTRSSSHAGAVLSGALGSISLINGLPLISRSPTAKLLAISSPLPVLVRRTHPITLDLGFCLATSPQISSNSSDSCLPFLFVFFPVVSKLYIVAK